MREAELQENPFVPARRALVLLAVLGCSDSPTPTEIDAVPDIDFDEDLLEPAGMQSIMEKHCARFSFEGVATTCRVHNGNHFHAYIGRTHYHR